MTRKRTLVVTAAIVACAIIAAIIAIVVSTTSSDASTRRAADTHPHDSHKKTHGNDGTSSTKKPLHRRWAKLNETEAKVPEEKLTNPLNETYSVTALAIGDWGRTVAKEGGSCCSRRKHYTVLDYNAMEYTASLLGLAAQQLQPRPSVVIGHGDNFYWTGLQSASDQMYRFQETFETKYSDVSLQGIPWINVMGNHDYGGASFLCASGDSPAMCTSTEEMLYNLNQKFTLQAQYISPNDNRWLMSDHFYVHTLQDPTTNLQIDIFNLDTNDADSHGAAQICCQCYGYSGGDDDQCDNVIRGQAACAGGDTGMYDACMKQLRAWGLDSRNRLVEAVKASNATWKIVNTHYSPYNHFAPEQAQKWFDILDGLGIQLFLYGHTHGEKHDYSSFHTHFVENGAGGGIQNESPSGIPPFAKDYIENVWAAGNYPYGIFDLKVSPKWLQLRFLTFDDQWIMNKDVSASVIGGIAVKHCWYIPQNGRKGMSCEEADAAAL